MFLKIKMYTHAKLNLKKDRTDYLNEVYLALNNLERLMGHKTQTTNQFFFFIFFFTHQR